MPQQQGMSQGAWKVTLAGQDITTYCSEKDFTAQDTLGQGPGVAAGGSGRATTATLRTRLGPAANAIGAGQSLPASYTNLLAPRQADFQDTGASWFLFNWSLSMDAAIQLGGNPSLKAVSAGTSGFEDMELARLSPSSFVGGASYTWSIWLYGDGAHTVRFYVQEGSGSNLGSVQSITPPAAWTRYSTTVTIPNPPNTGGITYYALRIDTGSPAQVVTLHMGESQLETGSVAHTWIPGGTSVKPSLVRQGEVVVYDVNGAVVFGGYATHVSDSVGIKESGRSTIYTDVECHDYWQDLDRINVTSEVYDGQTDTFIINDLLTKYATSIGRSLIPAASSGRTLGPMSFKNTSVQKAIQKVADKYGYAVWIDYTKNLHYVAPGSFASAPFSLAQNPNFSSSYQTGFDSYDVDDTGAINRVTFYGGKRLSNDYTQDLSPLCNGNTDTIPLAYYPHHAAAGGFPVKVGGVSQVVGYYGGVGNANALKKNGGNCDVLINVDAHTLIFNVAPSNTGVNAVTCTYRYEAPLVVQITDNNSRNFYGRYLDGTIHDETVFDAQTAVARCRVLLSEQSMGLATLKVRCWRAGIQAGMLLRVDLDDRNIHNSFLVQSVSPVPKGGGFFEYQITAGAWHWNMVDFLMTAAQNASPTDDTNTESVTVTVIQPFTESANVAEAWSKTTRAMSSYVFGTAQFGLSSF